MNDDEILSYVKAAAAVLDLPLDEARALRVAAHLARTAELARMLESAALGLEDEPAGTFRAAPFPSAGAPQ